MFSTRFGIHGYVGTLVGGPSVVILLHFDGDFDDSSVNNFTVTQQNGATTSSDQSKFGGSSLLSNPGFASISSNSITNLGSDDWTIELWYYQSGGTYATLAGAWGGGEAWYLGNTAFYINNTGLFSWDLPTLNTWHHVALVRKLNNISLYLDGLKIFSTSFSDPIINNNTFIGIGRDYMGNQILTGYVDDFRLVKGLAVYDGDFIVPDSALTTNAVAYTNYKTYGTLLFSECVDGDLVGTYADGNGGRYTETISVGSC